MYVSGRTLTDTPDAPFGTYIGLLLVLLCIRPSSILLTTQPIEGANETYKNGAHMVLSVALAP